MSSLGASLPKCFRTEATIDFPVVSASEEAWVKSDLTLAMPN